MYVSAVKNIVLKMKKRLAAFDFDHTIVEDNSDIVVRNLLRSDEIPESVANLYKDDGWTAYMQEIFKLLHQHKVSEHSIRDCIIKMKPVQGMKELITEMASNLNYDVIIISDSNSIFINQWLQSVGLAKYIKQVFTNPAWYEKGLLNIKMYHLQDTCDLSTKNLCKGQILSEFISEQKNNGVYYDKIVYAGDGKNDFCPILRLSCNDLACVRSGYRCINFVDRALRNLPDPQTGQCYHINSKICIWESGFDILKLLK